LFGRRFGRLEDAGCRCTCQHQTVDPTFRPNGDLSLTTRAQCATTLAPTSVASIRLSRNRSTSMSTSTTLARCPRAVALAPTGLIVASLAVACLLAPRPGECARSEEHTSALQSH